ncbi:MAG: alanine dehydrogenase [Bacteroidota bacterium]|nr:alanine dehydrogenase [Bacteroidota bacterium]
MDKLKQDEIQILAKSASVLTKEEYVKHTSKRKSLSIGIPKEISDNEKRVPLTPSAINILINNDFKVIIEKDAGINARFTNHQYSEAGAIISESKKEVYQSDIILKIAFPSIEDIKLLKKNQLLISSLSLSHLEKQQLELLIEKKTTAISFEFLKDDYGFFPIVQSMSEIAGREAVFIASEYLSDTNGKGILLGGITGVPPTEIVVIGAGIVGKYATKNALALGASIKVFDNSVQKLRDLHNTLGVPFYSSILQPDIFNTAVKNADVVICAIKSQNNNTNLLITEEMISQMKEGSLLIDISIDQENCCETSKATLLEKPVFTKHGVTHYCVPNIPSRVPQTASVALSNILSQLLVDLINAGNIENYLWEKQNARNGIFLYHGILTNNFLGRKFNLNSKTLDILLTSNT